MQILRERLRRRSNLRKPSVNGARKVGSLSDKVIQLTSVDLLGCQSEQNKNKQKWKQYKECLYVED